MPSRWEEVGATIHGLAADQRRKALSQELSAGD